MSGTCVIGLQWGDEAKGKLVDLLTAQFDMVVRYQGGANAGHTVVIGDQTYKLHHIPSGILNEGVMNLVTPGVVLNPPTLLKEIDSLLERGVNVSSNMIISERAHVVCPWHLAEDRLLNDTPAAGESIGTTLRGIGPCYRDKVGRTYAVRLGDLYRDNFPERVREIVEAKNRLLASLSDDSEVKLDHEEICREFAGYAERLKPFVGDTTTLLLDAAESGKRLLFEGAQGALLDIDHGTFPFVTSSNSSGVGVCAGSGVPPKWINKVIGVAKCYSTRVGGGPFPTELENETGQHIRDKGHEYGTTTGRPRRCGWFDAVAVRYTARLSGVDCLSMMMLDVLSELPEIQVCRAYEIDGVEVNTFPAHVEDLRRAKPILETLPGWQKEITEVRSYDDLPENAKGYLNRISELVGRPVGVVSVGPDRAQTMFPGTILSDMGVQV
ncbi:adenylosuccinate synthase [Lignipirellula cremea]|uniref:Adenylosuccinate synthetase n=1 Tax=Lignipirellula cremea TaxID=2528010 RepID=A0A518DWZ1_9BACT|nr:adenylosuccinate synthase [Lignipirellula cremea]QDU96356.1 Adenylosuccinate synthetase [Lignipirellula cremea]